MKYKARAERPTCKYLPSKRRGTHVRDLVQGTERDTNERCQETAKVERRDDKGYN